MTLPLNSRLSALYDTNGTQKDFGFGFRVFFDPDNGGYGLEVRRQIAGGYEIIPKSDYLVLPVEDNSSGVVRFNVAPSAGQQIYIAGKTPTIQQLVLTNFGRYSAESIETQFDFITAIIQEWISGLDEETRQRIENDQLLKQHIEQRINDFIAVVDSRFEGKWLEISEYLDTLLPMFFSTMREEIEAFTNEQLPAIINQRLSEVIDAEMDAYLDDLSHQVSQNIEAINEAAANATAAESAKNEAIVAKNQIVSEVGETKNYFVEALSQLSTAASKYYSTLAEANYYITYMGVNELVYVGGYDGAEGLYYKANPEATNLTKSAYDPLTQAKADATTKANTAEVNAKDYTNEKTSGVLIQSSIDDSDIEIVISNRRGLQTWLQVNKDGKPTDFVYQLIQAYLSNNLLHNTSGSSGFIVSDRRGTALIDSDQSAVTVNSKYDLTTVKFHGSSTMRFMQDELFAKLKNEFKQIQTALYTNRNSGGTLNDLATEIGINDGLLKFTDNKIYAAAPSPVIGAGLKYGLPNTYDIPISLTNGFKGTLKNTGFIASNVTSDFELPADLEINFKSDMTDYANCVSIVNLGKNNMSGSNTVVVNNIVGMTRDAIAFLDKENGGHTLVIGHTTNRGSSVDFIKNVKDVNAQLKALYFKRYFGLFDYIFSGEIWIDTGLTKSSEDISAIADETLPPSLTNDGIHLNAAANSAVTTKIVQFIQTLGWY